MNKLELFSFVGQEPCAPAVFFRPVDSIKAEPQGFFPTLSPKNPLSQTPSTSHYQQAMMQPDRQINGRLIVSVIYAESLVLERALTELEKQFGNIDAETDELEYLSARDYVEEMGEDLKRRFFCFIRSHSPEKLAEYKERTRRVETKLAGNVGGAVFRSVNIDPLIMTTSGLTLATSRDAPHRICIGRGIFAEKALALIGKKFKPFLWTHPNYSEDDMIEFAHYVLANIRTVPVELSQPTSLKLF
ncbi:MAG: DUF4416 family protein [Candidatus Zixiibacteriota bacterium]